MPATAIRPSQLVDGQKLGRLQYVVFILCAITVFVDGYDTQALSYIAPVLSREWGLPPGALGPIFSAGLLGSLLGSFFLAPLSDRVGRKKVIVWSTAWIGVSTLPTAWASSLGELQVLRLLTGLGLGAIIPNALAIIAEYAPKHRRASLVTLTFCGYAVGAAIGGLAATHLVPLGGWQLAFKVGGAVTLLLCPLLQWSLPESLLYLALRAPDSNEAKTIVRRIKPDAAADTVLISDEIKSSSTSAAQLFQERRAPVTALLWVLAFLSLLDIYLLNNWLPTIINSSGLSINQAALATSAFQIGGIAGGIFLGVLVDRLGPVLVIASSYLAATLLIACAAYSSTVLSMTLAAFGAGFMVIGAQNCNNAVNANLYPTSARATALGWSLTVGRIGSVLGPLFAGMLLAHGVPPQKVLLAAAIPTLCAALVMLLAGAAMKRANINLRVARAEEGVMT